jgi:hypothetical protein
MCNCLDSDMTSFVFEVGYDGHFEDLSAAEDAPLAIPSLDVVPLTLRDIGGMGWTGRVEWPRRGGQSRVGQGNYEHRDPGADSPQD